ncbi:hypothetical protein NR800_27995 [Corallococcus interemptor]|uniref:SDH family Clp fold serine proteinase n=1 Tax=Corallococcus interemptor TaxID=2316720 RepID=UPI0035D4A8F5
MSEKNAGGSTSGEEAPQVALPEKNTLNGAEPQTAPVGTEVEQLRVALKQVTAQETSEEELHQVHALAQKWADLKKAPVLIFWPEGAIERTHAEDVHSVLEDLPDEVDHLWLILSSSGGSLDAAYQVGRILQSRGKKISAVIPRWAKSAATLLTLGCDEVVMHPLAELGPLDAQVETHRHDQMRLMSTLDAVKANDYLRLYAVDTFDKLMELITRRSPSTYAASVSMAATVLEPLIKPMYAKVDPVQLGEFDRALTLATEYGRRLMRRSYRSLSESERNTILTKLVKGYAAHSFVIDLDEAKALGLNVRAPNQEERILLNGCATFFSECELHHYDGIGLHQPSEKGESVQLAPGAAQA